MKLISAEKMREIDRITIEKYGIVSLVLMERAGKAVSDFIQSNNLHKNGSVIVIAGKGNNGGDGLVAARYLIANGIDCNVIILGSSSDLSPDARANWELLAPMTTNIFQISSQFDLAAIQPKLMTAGCIVDAIFGTGLSQNISGIYKATIDLINSLKAIRISVDIPSGLSADTGEILGSAVRANHTITLALAKKGFVLAKGPDYTGKIHVVDIGIPKDLIDNASTDLELITPDSFKKYFKKRDKNGHKGDYGHVVIFAGSLGHLGAGYLASLAALRAGCGLVTYCLPEKTFVRFDARFPEVMCDIIPDGGTSNFHPDGLNHALAVVEKKSAVVIGPAIGTSRETTAFVNSFLKKYRGPVVIDADGLNVLDLMTVKQRPDTILTPHLGEMSRLCGQTIKEIEANKISMARDFAKLNGITLILKGHNTVVATPDGIVFVNTTGNAGMATAGMGDALTGIIASFIAEGMTIKDATCAAVYLHGLAGDLGTRELGERSLITSDVIRKLPEAIKSVTLP